MKNTVLKNLNNVYKRENPSTYLTNLSKIKNFIENRKNFLRDLKLPSQIFKDSSMIDFGCGSGQNSIVYDWLGANCTLLEYDKDSIANTTSLFKKFAKNKYKIIRTDLFNFKLKKKYDFVISNGVIHHTKDPLQNIKICCKAVKKNGFLILGWGETNGFFQRNIQRLILSVICKNEEEVIKFSKILFKDHLKSAVKYSGRTINEVIFDTYVNPKIDALSLEQVMKELYKNKLTLYSSDQPIKELINFSNPYTNQFALMGNKKPSKHFPTKKIIMNNLQNFSLSNQDEHRIGKMSQFLKINSVLEKVVNKVNNNSNNNKIVNAPLKEINNLKKNILKLKKVNIIDKKHNIIFIDEMINLFKILNNKTTKINKYKQIQILLKKSKKILKGKCGVGMKYLVAYKA